MGECPELIIDTAPTTNLFNIPAHIEYVVFELLKNSMRATVENSRKTKLSNLAPIIIKTYSSDDVNFQIILEDLYRDS
jgi:26S proteasome regulatory subunit T1